MRRNIAVSRTENLFQWFKEILRLRQRTGFVILGIRDGLDCVGSPDKNAPQVQNTPRHQTSFGDC